MDQHTEIADDTQIWSDAAKALTLQAAVSVGLGAKGTLPLITEPEAAAVYTLKSMKHDLNVTQPSPCPDLGGLERAYKQVFSDKRYLCSRRLWRRYGGRLRSSSLP